jgi:hypothetical protein
MLYGTSASYIRLKRTCGFLTKEEEIRKLLVDNYFNCLKLDSLDRHCAAFAEDVRTFIGNSEKVRDEGLVVYRKRLESGSPWMKLHEPAHVIDERDVKVTIDQSDPNLASATAWLTDQEPKWFDTFSLRKEHGTCKIFKFRCIPEGGAPP